MSRFSDIAKGTQAIRRVPFPKLFEGANELEVGLKVLSPADEANCLSAAKKFAESRGVKSPGPKEPLYELGLMVATVRAACVDPDNPEAPFFESEEQILQPPMSREVLAYLYEHQEIWQDRCSPRADVDTLESAIQCAFEVAQADEEKAYIPFVQLPPGSRVNCIRFMAHLLLNLQMPNSETGHSTEESGSDSTEAAKTTDEQL